MLPRAVAGGGVALVPTDYVVLRLRSDPATAAGTAVITCNPVAPDELWRLERINVSSKPTGTGVTCRLYDGDPVVDLNYVDGTTTGSGDTSDLSAPITVESTRQLYLVWSGLPPGAVASARVQYVACKRVSG